VNQGGKGRGGGHPAKEEKKKIQTNFKQGRVQRAIIKKKKLDGVVQGTAGKV